MKALAGDGAESVSGQVEHVTYHSEETGFFVARIVVEKRREPVVVVGSAASIQPGEWLHAEGRWQMDRQHGRQFKAERVRLAQPSSLEGIQKYLASGLIKGIGPKYAERLVARFGAEVFQIIDAFSKRLEEVPGIGPERRARIKAAWEQQKAVRDIMVFLHSYGLGTSRAVRIFKTYGHEAVALIRANPYRLAADIPGIGFKTADELAGRLDIGPQDPFRLQAGLRYTLVTASAQGHCALPTEPLIVQTEKLLNVGRDRLPAALEALAASGEVGSDEVEGERWWFLPELLRGEQRIAEVIRALVSAPPTLPALDVDRALARAATETGMALASGQAAAVRLAWTHRVAIITGGPGVGKTTVLNTLLRIASMAGVPATLCAPTGRAAKRLQEATGQSASTIHRLLGGRVEDRADSSPMGRGLMVVDETSMIDVPLMARFLKALPPEAHLVLVGDPDQLPSVGPGAVLGDLLASGIVPVARLKEVFRQAATSRIVTSAHRILRGEPPEPVSKGEPSDFYFVERTEPDRIMDTVLEFVCSRIPKKFGLDPKTDIQVLTPMNRGSLGTGEFNRRLQETLNPAQSGRVQVERFGVVFRPGDKVIQTRNNYDKEVFNGDIGQITGLDEENGEVNVSFEGREVCFEFGELDELQLAYAITVHKAQGSEYPAVVIPLATAHYLLLQRNLLYTAVTRGRKLVVIIGDPKALDLCLRNTSAGERFTGLKDCLTRPRG